MPQPLHVVEQVLASGLAQYLSEKVAEQTDIPAHRRRYVLTVGVPAHPASVATLNVPGAGSPLQRSAVLLRFRQRPVSARASFGNGYGDESVRAFRDQDQSRAHDVGADARHVGGGR
jgi:hypothetical protein